MTDIQITFEKPDFELGQTVFFVAGPGDIEEAEIRAFRAWILEAKEGIMAVAKAARLSIFASSDYFDDVDYDDVPLKYLTTDKK